MQHGKRMLKWDIHCAATFGYHRPHLHDWAEGRSAIHYSRLPLPVDRCSTSRIRKTILSNILCHIAQCPGCNMVPPLAYQENLISAFCWEASCSSIKKLERKTLEEIIATHSRSWWESMPSWMYLRRELSCGCVLFVREPALATLRCTCFFIE